VGERETKSTVAALSQSVNSRAGSFKERYRSPLCRANTDNSALNQYCSVSKSITLSIPGTMIAHGRPAVCTRLQFVDDRVAGRGVSVNWRRGKDSNPRIGMNIVAENRPLPSHRRPLLATKACRSILPQESPRPLVSRTLRYSAKMTGRIEAGLAAPARLASPNELEPAHREAGTTVIAELIRFPKLCAEQRRRMQTTEVRMEQAIRDLASYR